VSNLSSLEEANKLKKQMAQGAHLMVEVTAGKLTGTVARVVEIKQKHFNRHDYRLEVDGRRQRWWQQGDTLIEVSAHANTNYCDNSSTLVYRDTYNQIITEGTVVCFSRASRVNCGIEMVFATVRSITLQGLMARPFKINNDVKVQTRDVLVRKPSHCVVINKELTNAVIMTKLAAP
jgi:hypothetical protein